MDNKSVLCEATYILGEVKFTPKQKEKEASRERPLTAFEGYELKPSARAAYNSIKHITEDIVFGHLMRSLHYHASNGMIILPAHARANRVI